MSSRSQPKRNRGALSTDRIFNSTSPIITEDIQAFLSLCMINWLQYSEQEKSSIIDSLPSQYRHKQTDDNGYLICPLSPEFVAKDRLIRDNVAAFQREVEEGYYTKTWQEKARRAMQERADGKFDEYLKEHADEMFGDERKIKLEDELADSDEDFDMGKKIRKRGRERSKKDTDVGYAG